MKTLFFTRKGDNGESVISHKKFKKSDVFFNAIGSLDELNSFLGVIRAETFKKDILLGKDKFSQIIFNLQEKIFKVQAEIASFYFSPRRKSKFVDAKDIEWMEEIIKKIDLTLPPLKNFVIPGDSLISAYLDLGRAISRRAEREIVLLFSKEGLKNKNILSFVNRISSLLFALARYANFKKKIKEAKPSYR